MSEKQMTGWQPIETAPRDGTEILIRTADGVAVGAWQTDYSEWPWNDDQDPGFYVRRLGDWDIYDGFAPQQIYDPIEWAAIPGGQSK